VAGNSLATPGKWCLGHGVAGQAESLRHGHYVEGYLVKDCFSLSNGTAVLAKGFGQNLHSRCALCRSIIQWHDHHANAERRAKQFLRQHAERWVKKGKHDTTEAALTEMDIGGVTVEAITQLILAALGEFCPGYCAYEQDRQIIRHTIDSVVGLHVDVKNPDDPFSIENIGILCISCNTAKQGRPWGVFIYRRRAHLRMWQAGIDNPSFRRPERRTLFDDP
jgi:hypothetical protein